MQKEINCKIRLVLKGGEANPGLKQIGPQLGGKVGNIMDFCKQFNAQTSERKGVSLRVVVTAYKNKEKSFDFIILGSPTSELIKSKAKIQVGSGEPNKKKVASISMKDAMDIANEQLKYTNSFSAEKAVNSVIGTAKRMGVEII